MFCLVVYDYFGDKSEMLKADICHCDCVDAVCVDAVCGIKERGISAWIHLLVPPVNTPLHFVVRFTS